MNIFEKKNWKKICQNVEVQPRECHFLCYSFFTFTTRLRGMSKRRKNENNPEMFIFKKGNPPVQVIFEELNGKENIFIIPNFRGSPYLFWSVINTHNC
jgi:hypothetical protein